MGMDETFGLGLGEYLNKHGLKDKKALLLEYLKEVVKIAKKYGFEIEIWGDMLLDDKCTSISEEQIKKELPEHTLVWLWDYETMDETLIRSKIEGMKSRASEIGFAGCVWKHISYVANNDYSIPRLVKQLEVCGENSIDKYMVTIWGDFGIPSSIFSVLPSLYLTAETNQNHRLDKEKFEDIVGIGFDDLLSLDLLNNPYGHDRVKYHNNTSYIAFFSDLLLGNYDLYASKETKAKYASLSTKYHRIAKKTPDPYFGLYFKMIGDYAKVLSLKLHLASNIRGAYEKKDKAALKNLADGELNKYIRHLESFCDSFEAYYLHENQAFGLEVSQLHHSHMLGRAKYLKKAILKYVNEDAEIGEFKEKTLKSDFHPDPSEDCYLDNNFDWLITYNTNR